MTGNPRQTELLFEQALELPADQRSAFLHKACGTDTKLLARVQDLLSLVENEANDDNAERKFLDEEGVGHRIDRYDLKSVLGEGGFGVVYLAEQTEPVTRRVALKIIKLGMDTRAVLRRFEAERQTLAMLDHSDIARLLDGGQTKSGRPYFVMEYVDGRSITEYCDSEKLGITRRLELFKHACEAVQHAHTKGVIHRDIKPSNILVATIDGKAIVKVIDFGISKLLDTRGDAKLLVTESGQFIGTPDYMSPEQASGSADIDTRGDVYSLGVVLYELLTGLRLFDQDVLRNASIAELQRVIREVDPLRPSTRLTSLLLSDRKTVCAIAESRMLNADGIVHQFRGEFDWIVMRCLEKDRNRRYESVNNLLADLDRHERHQPLEAGPPSVGYRLRKLARRRAGLLVSLAVVTAVIVGGAVVSLNYAFDAQRQRAEALVQRDRTQEQLARAKASLRFIDFLFQSLSPFQKGRDVRLFDVLQTGSTLIDTELGPSPLVAAEINLLFGSVYSQLEEKLIADKHLRRAKELLESQVDADPELKSDVLLRLAYNDAHGVNGEIGLRQLETCVNSIEVQFPRDDPKVFEANRLFARALLHANKKTEAYIVAKKALSLRSKEQSDWEMNVLDLKLMLAWESEGTSYDQTRAYTSAVLKLYDEAAKQVGGGNSATIFLGYKYCQALGILGMDVSKPIPQRVTDSDIETVIKIAMSSRRTLGPQDSNSQKIFNDLASLLYQKAQYSESSDWFQEALSVSEALFGKSHIESLHNRMYCAAPMINTGQVDKAMSIIASGSEIARVSLGQDHPITQAMLALLKVLQELRNDGDTELALCKVSLISIVEQQGSTCEFAGHLRVRLAGLLINRGKWQEANKFYEDNINACYSSGKPDNEVIARMWWGISLTLAQDGVNRSDLKQIKKAEEAATKGIEVLAKDNRVSAQLVLQQLKDMVKNIKEAVLGIKMATLKENLESATHPTKP